MSPVPSFIPITFTDLSFNLSTPSRSVVVEENTASDNPRDPVGRPPPTGGHPADGPWWNSEARRGLSVYDAESSLIAARLGRASRMRSLSETWEGVTDSGYASIDDPLEIQEERRVPTLDTVSGHLIAHC